METQMTSFWYGDQDVVLDSRRWRDRNNDKKKKKTNLKQKSTTENGQGKTL